MIRKLKFALALTLGLVLPATVSAAGVRTTVSKEEALHWIRYTVPLPKQIELTAKVTLPARKVAVRTVGGEGIALVEQAARELREALGAGDAQPSDTEALFTITLQLGGDEAKALAKDKHADRAT